MNSLKYFDFIEERLSLLAQRIETRGSLNILDYHLHAETFYMHFLNLLFDWKLANCNTKKQNTAGIDLVDSTKKIIVQVSATATKAKIDSVFSKNLSSYQGYSFKFISISKDAKKLRTNKYNCPPSLTFLPSDDIFDIPFLLKKIKDMEIDRLKKVYEFIEKELKDDPGKKIESNLTTIIQILSKTNWNQGQYGLKIVPHKYEIEAKISYNQLDRARPLIDDYKIHYSRLDKIYSVFNKEGANKSLSVLNSIRSDYLTMTQVSSHDDRFFSIIDKVIQKILASANYTPMPEEEIRMCVELLVVDAFIRCKIFENPLGNTNAHS